MDETRGADACDAPACSLPSLTWLRRDRLAGWECAFLPALLLLLAAMLWPLLGRVPRAYGDDSWSTMAGCTLAFEGVPRNPPQTGRGATNEFLLQPRLFSNLVCAPVYRWAGYGLVQGRAVATLFCGLFVFSSWAMARRLFGPVAAAVIAVLVAVDPWVFLTGRTCREEIFLAGLLWPAWFFLLGAVDRNCAVRGFLGGLLTGLACWAHPNAVPFSVAGGIAFGLVVGPRRMLGRWLGWAVVGLFVGLAPYGIYVALVQHRTNLRLMDQLAERSAAYARPLREMLAVERERWVNFLQLPVRLPLVLLYGAGLAWTALRGKAAHRLMLLLVLSSSVLLPIVVCVGHGRYLVVLVPALAAVVWEALAAAAHAAAAKRRRWLLVGTLGLYAAMSLGPTLAVVYTQRGADYDAWIARIARSVPAGARVMGHSMFWMGLRDREFISSIPPFYGDWRDVSGPAAHVGRYQPTYLIQSSLDYGAVGGLSPRPRDLRSTWFGQACELVASGIPSEALDEFYDRDFGAVRVWRLHWPAPHGPASSTAPAGGIPMVNGVETGKDRCFCCHRGGLRDVADRFRR
jgi:hypothetical protein